MTPRQYIIMIEGGDFFRIEGELEPQTLEQCRDGYISIIEITDPANPKELILADDRDHEEQWSDMVRFNQKAGYDEE